MWFNTKLWLNHIFLQHKEPYLVFWTLMWRNTCSSAHKRRQGSVKVFNFELFSQFFQWRVIVLPSAFHLFTNPQLVITLPYPVLCSQSRAGADEVFFAVLWIGCLTACELLILHLAWHSFMFYCFFLLSWFLQSQKGKLGRCHWNSINVLAATSCWSLMCLLL